MRYNPMPKKNRAKPFTMLSWFEYFIAFIAFLVTHSLPLRPSIRPMLTGWLSPTGFTMVYSLLSLLVLAWLIGAAGRAPYVGLWSPAPWQAWIPMIAMLIVCWIVVFGLFRPNPFSFGGLRNYRFDPNRPGLIRWTRHPLLLALALWSAAHLVPNGDLAHVVLFGGFSLFALAGMKIVDRRKQRMLGLTAWRAGVEAVRRAPRIAGPRSWPAFLAKAGLSFLLYALLISLHPIVFGVSPWV